MFVFTFICFLLTDVTLSKTDVLTINLEEYFQCIPKKIYKDDNKTCVCTNNGTWPNQECVSSFDPDTENKNCEPNKYIFVDCNVCLCGPDGKINKSRCSQHNCVNLNKTRRSDAIVGKCDPKKFYELVPCQVCYCVNKNKLVCTNTPKTDKLKLGPYNLNKCGDNLIKDLTDLLPKKQQRSLKKSNIYKTRSAKKKMTTAILLDGSNKNSLVDLSDSSDKDIKKYNDAKDGIVNIRHQQSFERINYDKEESEMRKAITSDGSNDDSIEYKKKSSNIKSKKSYLDPIAYVSGLIDGKNISEPLIINVPSVLDKVLNFVLRKSMVHLESGSNCTPGTKIKKKCNTCFCLVNGKMICTEKTC